MATLKASPEVNSQADRVTKPFMGARATALWPKIILMSKNTRMNISLAIAPNQQACKILSKF